MRYESFERGEWDRFLYLMDMGYILKKKKPPWKAKVSQTGGVVVKRFGVPPSKPPPYARLDQEVFMRPKGAPTHYVYRPAYKTKHIDIHPMAARLLSERPASPVYLCLEGSFKADAVLSVDCISASSTSVTTWNCQDLKKLLPHLKASAAVYVVPDSDYYSSEKFAGSFNPMVRWHTQEATQWLASRGVEASIRVPWLGKGAGKVGVDDFLAMGNPVTAMARQGAYFDPIAIGAYPLTKYQVDVLQWLLRHQGPHGTFYPNRVAKAVGATRKTVTRAYQRFVELGMMQVWPGRPVAIPGGMVNTPHVFKLMQELDVDYGTWLGGLPVPSGRG